MKAYRPSTTDLTKRQKLQDFWCSKLKVSPQTIATDPLDTSKWLKQRQSGIGASDVTILFGLSPYRGLRNLYYTKVKDDPPVFLWEDSEDHVAYSTAPSEAADTGQVKEDFVAWQFCRRTKKDVFSPATMFKGVGKVQASIDRLVLNEKAILEIKTVNTYDSKYWANGQIPDKVYYQVQAQLSAFAKEDGVFAYVIAEIGGQHYVIRKVERNEEVIAKIGAESEKFWSDYVEPRREPKAQSENDLITTNEENKEVLTATADEEAMIKELIELKDQIKELEKIKDEKEVQLKDRLRDHLRLEGKKYYCNFSKSVKLTVDTKALQTANEELYKSFLVDKPVFDEQAFIEANEDSCFVKEKVFRRFTVDKLK